MYTKTRASLSMLCLLVLLCSLIIQVEAQNQLPSVSDFYRTPPVWSSDGLKVASANGANIQIWDTLTGVILQTLVGHTGDVTALAWGPDGSSIASGSTDQSVRIWNSLTGELVYTLSGHNETISAVIWSPDGRRIVSIGAMNNPNIYVWNATLGELLSTHTGGTVAASGIAFSPDGSQFVYVAGDVVFVLDGNTFARIARFSNDTDQANNMSSVAWSPDGTRLVTGSLNGVIYVWDSVTGQSLYRFAANSYYYSDAPVPIENLQFTWVRSVAFAPSGDAILSAAADGTVHLFDLTANQIEASEQLSVIANAAWSPYGGRLAYFDFDTATNETTVSVERASGNMLQVTVPFPSLERLQAIANACNAPTAVEEALTASVQVEQLTNLVVEVEALPEDTIPPACAADLIAVAEALQSE